MSSPLRLARPEDREGFEALMADFYAEAGYPLDRPRAFAALGRLLSEPALGRLWAIEVDGETAGYVAVTFGFSLEHHGRDAFVDELYLRPAWRGAGLGARVLAAVEAACRELGVGVLHLEVERDNEAGQGLYRKRGFRDDGRMLLSKRLAP